MVGVIVVPDLDRDRAAFLLGGIAPAWRRQLHDLFEQGVHLDVLGDALLAWARKRQQASDGLTAAHRRPHHHFQRLVDAGDARAGAAERPEREVAVPGDQPEALIQIVRHAAGKLPERP